MKTYVYRNYTIEYLFDKQFIFSGYGDITVPDDIYNDYLIFFQLNPSSTPDQVVTEIKDIKSKVEFILNSLPNNKRIIIFTLKEVFNADWDLDRRQVLNSIKQFNTEFLEKNKLAKKNLNIIDVNSFLAQKISVPHIDWKFFFISQMIINPKLVKDFRNWYAKQVDALELKRKKCIVLDCDNTLWGGVLGEEGVFGIKLGEEYPGISFKKFQQLLVESVSKGIILAICSKNNEADVFEVWEKNSNNVLNSNSISSYRISWQDKLTNLSEIAEELNIGLDSIVFIDDNPVERNLVKEFLPEVIVPDFPEQPYLLVDFFWNLYNEYFITNKFSDEDLNKTTQYKENIKRSKAKTSFTNIDEYLQSLNIEIDIFYANESNIARIAQMTQKTNQFNLTTKRYTVEDITNMLENKAIVFCAGVKDKFGNNGTSVAGILRLVNEYEVNIDSYLLSCRILGRNIEKQVLLVILKNLYKKGFKKVTAEYIPTKKNMLAANFFEELCFTMERKDSDGTKHYSFLLDQNFSIPNYYTINFYEG